MKKKSVLFFTNLNFRLGPFKKTKKKVGRKKEKKNRRKKKCRCNKNVVSTSFCFKEGGQNGMQIWFLSRHALRTSIQKCCSTILSTSKSTHTEKVRER
jgi:hypothetical protein